MITFFRRIREKLIASGSITKYLLYAIGEIMLVVIGILIALQVNNWYSGIEENRLAEQYVERLISDLRSDSLQFSAFIDQSHSQNQVANKVYSFYQGNDEAFQNPTEALIAVQNIGRTWVPFVQDNTYQDLISTGNIRLIRDKNLSDRMIQYYSFRYGDWFENYKNRMWDEYIPAVINLFSLDFLQDIITFENSDTTATSILDLQNYRIALSAEESSEMVQRMRNSTEFEFQIKHVARTHMMNASLLKGILQESNQLLADFERYQADYYGEH